MTSVTQLKNGNWLVIWDTGLKPFRSEVRETNVSCPLDFMISTYVTDSTISLQIEDRACTTTGEVLRSVAAVYNFEYQEMHESASSCWGPTSWEVIKEPNHDWPYAIFILILEYQVPNADSCPLLEGQKKILDHLATLLTNPSSADVQFIVKGQSIKAHSAILSSSPILATMIEKDNRKGQVISFQIDDIEPDVFNEMLRYLYTGSPVLDDAHTAEQLLIAAERYQIESLKNICEDELIRRIDIEKAIRYLVVAHQNASPYLLEASIDYLNLHKKAVWTLSEWKLLAQKYPDLFFMASHRMIG